MPDGDYEESWFDGVELPDESRETLGLAADGYGPANQTEGGEEDPYALPKDGSMDWESLPNGKNTDGQDHSQQLENADGAEERIPFEDEAGGAGAPPSKGAIDKILDFGSTVGGALGDAIKKDPLKAVQFLGGSLASWYAADEKKKAADLANRNLTQAQIDKENRLNASVTGQSAPKGIIQRELQRTDGSAVFNANRNINRG